MTTLNGTPIPTWPQYVLCPESHASEIGGQSDMHPYVAVYRGYLVHGWHAVGLITHWCATPYGDLAGVPVLLDPKWYHSSHGMEIDGKEIRTYHVAPYTGIDPYKDVFEFIDAQWKPWEDALASLARDHTHDEPYTLLNVY